MMMVNRKVILRSRISVVVLGCACIFSAQTVLAEPGRMADRDDVKIVEQKRVEEVIPGSYHYESSYEMIKEKNGTYRSTYQSEKKEWFCCLHLFSSEEMIPTKSDKS